MDTPFKDLPKAAKKRCCTARISKSKCPTVTGGDVNAATTGFEGVMDYVKRKHDEAESDQARDRYQSYMREVACTGLWGASEPTSLSVLVGGRSIAEVSAMPMQDSINFMRDLDLSARDAKIADQVLIEIKPD